MDRSFCRDQVVVDRLAAGDEVDFGVGGVLLEQSQGLFGVGFGDIGAVEDVDEFLSGRRGLVREGGEQGGDVLRGPGQRAVAQAQVVA